jgi:uncharacterized protein (TIGR02646 family)
LIRVRRGPTPIALNGVLSKGGQERIRAVAHFADVQTRDMPFDFAAYKDTEVVQALAERFGRKCAYCESKWGAVSPVDVEHFRPKSGVVVDGELRKPGYYWLAASWDNLLPSCIDCNRARTQEFPNEDPRVSGKANKFPIVSEARRAVAPDEESNEDRLLLHPCRDFPEGHLEFTDDGVVRPRLDSAGRPSPKALSSIEVYGLQRVGLVHERERVLKYIKGQMEVIRRLVAALDADSGRQDLAQTLEVAIRELERYVDAGEPYAGMARQVIERFRAGLVGH